MIDIAYASVLLTGDAEKDAQAIRESLPSITSVHDLLKMATEMETAVRHQRPGFAPDAYWFAVAAELRNLANLIMARAHNLPT